MTACTCGAPGAVSVPDGDGAVRQCWTCAGVEPTAEATKAVTFSEVIEAALPHLRRLALRLTRNEADADDVVQDAVVKAFTRWEKFDVTRGEPRTWLAAIVRNQFISEVRKRKLRPVASAAIETAATDDRDLVLYLDTSRRLDTLHPDQRAVLALAMEGERYQDIAAKLSIPIGTVMSRLWSARRAMNGLSVNHAKRMAD